MCRCFSIARGCLQYEDFVTFSVPPSADISLLLHLDATGMHSIRTVCNASLPVSRSCLSNKFVFFQNNDNHNILTCSPNGKIPAKRGHTNSIWSLFVHEP